MSSTNTTTTTYSVADVQAVMRRLTADFVMIAQSTGAIPEQEARDYAHDIGELAVEGYLKKVDVMLMSGEFEMRAAVYEPNINADGLTSSRPGGVRWPRVDNAKLIVVISYSETYTADAREKMRSKLKIPWGPSSINTSHSSLTQSDERDYASNAYSIKRKDWS